MISNLKSKKQVEKCVNQLLGKQSAIKTGGHFSISYILFIYAYIKKCVQQLVVFMQFRRNGKYQIKLT